MDRRLRRHNDFNLKREIRKQNIKEYVVAPILTALGISLGQVIGIALIKLVLG